jgi:hypothetical protein
MDVPVISYNMSVFSAMGNKEAKFASEYSFLQRAAVVDMDGMKVTDFFVNSLDHLANTVQRIDAKVIGIQEFHPPTLGMIQSKLANPNFAYHAFSKTITNNAAVLTIWDQEVLGSMVAPAYDEDLGLTEGVEGLLPNDKGRPISIIKTTKGYILINFHGINRPKYNADGSETGKDNSAILKNLLAVHTSAAGVMDANKVIIMCDSNDRSHGINMESPLMINGVGLHDGHAAADITETSCCYNWDSCGVPISGGKVTLGTVGAEANYKYTGDYVLGANLSTPVIAELSAQDADGASIESDHKLVYAVVSVPVMNGGRRHRRPSRGRRHRSRNNNRKNRRSRKNRRNYRI